MSSVYVSYNNIVSPLGFDSIEVVDAIASGKSGLREIEDHSIIDRPFYSSVIPEDALNEAFEKLDAPNPIFDRLDALNAAFDRWQSPSSLTAKKTTRSTRLEKMMLVSLAKTLEAAQLKLTERVGLIVSTTKGNIDVLENDSPFSKERSYLSELGKQLKTYFGFKTETVILSNACVSGVLALAVAKRLVHQDKFDHVFVVAGDLVTPFILSGFNSFQALSSLPCRPYCKTRSGINIGEVAASVLVTKDKNYLAAESVEILGDASCNDANHISGPSRTGEGLYRSVTLAMKEAQLSPEDIHYISAHGTATQFNDEMEAIAFNRAGLQNIPLNSLKGYFGHTLGASGLLETVVGMHSLHRNTLFASRGFEELGVSKPLNVIEKTTFKKMDTFLKTASGFGGSNTAAVFQKIR